MYYLSEIQAAIEKPEGTYLKVFVPNEGIVNNITKYKVGNIINSEIRIDDRRTITNQQRAKIFATIKDISVYTGDHPEDLRAFLLYDYCIATGEIPFSLSNCSISQAKEFITFIIDFILKHNIPLSDAALNRTDDIDKYLYMCIKYRKCSITGQANADIHHCTGSRIGMGGDRRQASNKGRELIALSREWHNRVHQEGEKTIFDLYKIYGITVSEDTLKELKLSKADLI